MASSILKKVKSQADIDGTIALILSNIPKTVKKSFRRKLLPQIRDAMLRRMGEWPDAVLSKDGIQKGFMISERGNSVSLINVAPYATALIAGVNKHGPVYIGDWAEKGKIEALRRPDGSYSKFTEVGGKNSRIKTNMSQRDFWTPVLDDYFGKNGLATKQLSKDIYKDLKRRIK